MHRVIEVARILGVSKVTVYKKMELLKRELKPYIRYRSNIAYIEEPGVEILRRAMALPQKEGAEPEASVPPDVEPAGEESLRDALNLCRREAAKAYDLHCSDLLQQLETVSHMIRVRREEIGRKERQLKMLQRLVKWNKSSLAFVEKMQDAVGQSGE